MSGAAPCAGEGDLRAAPNAFYGPSHTDGDVCVYFVNADVLATGDTWWNGVYPFIDISTGGSIRGMLRAAEANVAMAREHTKVIPGHGPSGARSDLIEYRDMLSAVQASVAAMKQRGMTLDETIAAHPTASFDARWGQFVIDPALFTSLVYRSL